MQTYPRLPLIPSPLVQHFPENEHGRDFIVADLHGSLKLFLRALERVRFDSSRDRVFSVGDLGDRGEDSFGCLKLILEPWFFHVVGNHEDLLLTYLKLRESDRHSGSDFLPNGGGWLLNLTPAQKRTLDEVLLPKLLEAPLVIRVGVAGPAPFNLVHAELAGVDGSVLTNDRLTCERVASLRARLTWGRRLLPEALEAMSSRCWNVDEILVSAQAFEPGLSLTYVGHTMLPREMLHRSHLFIDEGAYLSNKLVLREHLPTVALLAAKGFRAADEAEYDPSTDVITAFSGLYEELFCEQT